MILNVMKTHPDAELPEYKHPGDAGFDLRSVEKLVILPGQVKLVNTGLAFNVPEGYEMQIRPRSGLSLKTKLRISNSPGTIDSGYTGTVKIIIENVDTENSYGIGIEAGDRIAQAVLAPVLTKNNVTFKEVTELAPSSRNEAGFGSTGVQ